MNHLAVHLKPHLCQEFMFVQEFIPKEARDIAALISAF
jgi:hypothetical protein